MVLVVDDHPTNRTLLVKQLMALGLRAETADNGEAALPLWRDGRFDLVITDCHMPVMDGYALAQAIREGEAETARPRIPIIAWTANVLAGEQERCYAAGMDDVLIKPSELGQVRDAVSKWLPAAAAQPLPAAREAARGPADTPIDSAVLNKISTDRAERIEILRDFQVHNGAQLAELKGALEQLDLPAAARVAHRIKGASGMIGAWELAAVCEAIEQAALDGSVEGTCAAGAPLDGVAARLETYLAEQAGEK